MANKIIGNRWVFDGVTTANQEAELLGIHNIIAIFWKEGPAADQDIAADDDLLILDSNDLEIYQERAAGTPATSANGAQVVVGYPGYQVNGFKVEALDGGILIVWLAIPYT